MSRLQRHVIAVGTAAGLHLRPVTTTTFRWLALHHRHFACSLRYFRLGSLCGTTNLARDFGQLDEQPRPLAWHPVAAALIESATSGAQSVGWHC